MKIQIELTKEQCGIIASCLSEISNLYSDDQDDNGNITLYGEKMQVTELESLAQEFSEYEQQGD